MAAHEYDIGSAGDDTGRGPDEGQAFEDPLLAAQPHADDTAVEGEIVLLPQFQHTAR